MTQGNATDLAVPPDLAAQLRAAAEEQHRDPVELLQDAVEQYLDGHRLPPESHRSPAEAAARMRRARHSNVRLDDASLRELLAQGRA